jgi:ATP-dependent Clp protease ATP-binding subunit ClpA
MVIENKLTTIEDEYSTATTQIVIDKKTITPFFFSHYDAETGVRPIVKKIENSIIPIIVSYADSTDTAYYMDLPRKTTIFIT